MWSGPVGPDLHTGFRHGPPAVHKDSILFDLGEEDDCRSPEEAFEMFRTTAASMFSTAAGVTVLLITSPCKGCGHQCVLDCLVHASM